jgi:formate dehydrogenase iron-sulfur subunit
MIAEACILTDVTRCIGCEQCVAACKRINHLPQNDLPPRRGSKPSDLSATRWTTIARRPGNRHVRQQCRHCLQPACVSVCPVGALSKTAEGPVVVDKSLGMGCRYCMLSCPFAIPRYEWTSAAPSVRKCILCEPHLRSGAVTEPACVTACPTEATIFGSRPEMLAEAHRRLAEAPGRYLPKVWGEREVGGTSVLLISDVSLDFLGWRDSAALGDDPLPDRTWAALKPVPLEFAGMGALMGTIYWIIERRRRLASHPEAGAPDSHDRKDGRDQ